MNGSTQLLYHVKSYLLFCFHDFLSDMSNLLPKNISTKKFPPPPQPFPLFLGSFPPEWSGTLKKNPPGLVDSTRWGRKLANREMSEMGQALINRVKLDLPQLYTHLCLATYNKG